LPSNDSRKVYNIGHSGSEAQRKVLVSYLLDSLSVDIKKHKYNTNRLECLNIINTFVDLGFSVDIVDCRDNYISRYDDNEYDIVFGFGENYRKSKIKKNGYKILYLTEASPDYSLENERQRLEYYNKRHGKEFDIERSGSYYTIEDINIADNIICLGEKHREHIINHYKISPEKIYHTYPTPLKSYYTKEIPCENNNDFLWFGSRGVIHKGLDILVDVFNDMPEKRLHICGVDEKTVRKYVTPNSNIKFYGKVNVNSTIFSWLIDNCNYSILLSCSEAVPTSVLTTMGAGLIPITTDKIGTKIPIGKQLSEYDVEFVREIISQSIVIPASKDIELAKKYSDSLDIESFRHRFNHIIGDIINE
tara:strand:+ start:985 stop:2070 length:1086 start_codon:yes stop_codon:yes gene_type:complete